MREIARVLVCISQFTIYMLVPIAMCFFGGLFLDKWLGTSFIAIVLFFVGALAGGRNVYRLAKKYFGEGKE
ncbi:MAG: AtpZ/AtpI family protein [Lachnospiraceae bacterium]|nr:AtpZ/AtpI family protein [Lachnospiraceae bacterium]